jgi:DNA helicase-2/ATP-dependent DNA helicase PcrA
MTRVQERSPDRAVELAQERAVNERYLREHRSKLAMKSAIQIASGAPRNASWVGGPVARVPLPGQVEALVGRVAFDIDDPLVGRGFYVSSWHHEWDDVLVVSWAAPIARLFYERRDADDELASNLIARRTLLARGYDLVDFDDELFADGPADGHPFALVIGTELRVPAAPPVARSRPAVRPKRPATAVGSSQLERRPPPASAGPPPEPRSPTETKSRLAHVAMTPAPRDGAKALPVLRAERLIHEVVNRPRTGQLTSLLATLQPEQYRLVTWSDTEPLLVQGQPGTGKTVIAAHRAAYLTNEGREEPLTKILLVGPTDAYVHHVTASVRQLEGSESVVEIRSLPRLLCQLGSVTSNPREEMAERLDGDRAWARLICQAAGLLRERGRLGKGRAEDTRTVVVALLERNPLLDSLQLTDEQRIWLAQLGRFERAERSSRYLPFLAAAGLAVHPIAKQTRWEHVLVDEAQDVRPLEWWILTNQLQLGSARSLSVFGDMNQRRSDWSCASWDDVAGQAGLGGTAVVHPETVDCGYRSTVRILAFANQLLPKSDRRVAAIREGVAPEVRKVTAPLVSQAAVTAAEDLSGRHPGGTVAVISMDQASISQKLRKRGWARSSANERAWTRAGRTVQVFDPGGARGLEFDGVVVVEPGDFPVNLGRHGQLYTSLTRATQELTVVHTRPLPAGLRPLRR